MRYHKVTNSSQRNEPQTIKFLPLLENEWTPIEEKNPMYYIKEGNVFLMFYLR